MSGQSIGPRYNIEFPLADGRRLIKDQDGRSRVTMPVSFDADGLRTEHSSSFLSSEKFREAYSAGANTGHRICPPEHLHIEWRVYICCWAATQALSLAGDFVECGVSTGITSRAVAEYCDFGTAEKTFYLFDTFAGVPLDQAADDEVALSESKNQRHYFDSYSLVLESFKDFPNVEVVKGKVPESLETVPFGAVAFLHVDMNIAYPEVAALEHFWPLLSPGAPVVLDDYGSQAHVSQKSAIDDWATRSGANILLLPTGQGLIIR
ncbi:TylF/MycF family methyltransferase [Nisaea acidiphila]|uniref:TylF/MycF family methyltransferase n=1 Tax=Nisaea acidiphila TaxID=1862145 RepID=A0A9J7AX83_9PROT|nr:TylF/MycF family methyltransferase [Nisaea acidiphila]UUX50069.1 TylF/MycF family methyltransferase [Nisaea acidiphila]